MMCHNHPQYFCSCTDRHTVISHIWQWLWELHLWHVFTNIKEWRPFIIQWFPQASGSTTACTCRPHTRWQCDQTVWQRAVDMKASSVPGTLICDVIKRQSLARLQRHWHWLCGHHGRSDSAVKSLFFSFKVLLDAIQIIVQWLMVVSAFFFFPFLWFQSSVGARYITLNTLSKEKKTWVLIFWHDEYWVLIGRLL